MTFTARHTALVIPLLLALVLLINACGGATASKATAAASNVTKAPLAQGKTTQKPGANATTPAQANTSDGNADCVAIAKANMDFGQTMPIMINFTADTDYPSFTKAGTLFYVDIAKTRKDLDALATLPDPTDAVELTFGKPSESVAYFREMVDVAEVDIKSEGKPFKDTGASGQKVIGFDTPWGKEFAPFALAIDKACPNFTLPADTPVSSQANLQIGQTGMLGDLRITLNKVTTADGTAYGEPAATGDRFLYAHFTIENKGQTPVLLARFGQTTFTDSAGNFYPFDNNANSILPPTFATAMTAELAPGAQGTGILGYQVHTNAGDLNWTVVDLTGHQDIFQVKEGDITAETIDQMAPGTDVRGTSVAATISALTQMSNDADATAAALTAVPVTDVPAATDEPAPTDEPTETPSS